MIVWSSAGLKLLLVHNGCLHFDANYRRVAALYKQTERYGCSVQNKGLFKNNDITPGSEAVRHTHGCNQHFSREPCAVIFILYQTRESAASRRADSNSFYILWGIMNMRWSMALLDIYINRKHLRDLIGLNYYLWPIFRM